MKRGHKVLPCSLHHRSETITNVDFCAATLRVLYADGCYNLSDDGLKNATKLEVLHVAACRRVTTVLPFAHCLVGLDASSTCGISSAALSQCYRLQVLHANENHMIGSLRPFASQLRELHAARSSVLGDAALAEATQLVKLDASFNCRVTTVAPFGSTLIELHAVGKHCEVDSFSVATITKLVCLVADRSRCIRSVAPFASRVLELDARSSMISDAVLAQETNLVWLDCYKNKHIFIFCRNSVQERNAEGTKCGE